MNLLIALFLALPVLTAFSVTRVAQGKIPPASAFNINNRFNNDCRRVIEAAKLNDLATVKKTLKRYRGEEDMLEILSMHSLINAARSDNLELVQSLVEEHGMDPELYNNIAKKQARLYNSLRVNEYFDSYSANKQHTNE